MPFLRYRKVLFYLLGLLIVASLIIPLNFPPHITPVQTASAESARSLPPNRPAYVSNCNRTFTHTYNVGPGQTYASIGAVPFSSLQPNSIVRIHWRATAYREKVIVSTQATANAPVCIVGVPGPSGELPIIDGNGATTSQNMYFDYDAIQQYGVFLVMHADYGDLPSYIYIEGLQIQGAYRAYQFTAQNGGTRTYTDNAAGIRIVSGEHIRITGCIITDNGNGIFSQTSGDPEQVSRDITIEYSYIYGNGTPNPGFDQRHNVYMESIGMTYQFNYFGPLRSGAGGNNIKDRSSNIVIRYNWIDSGAHLIDLVECEDSCAMTMADPNYHQAWIYGNVLVNNSTYRNTIHWGGDNGGEEPDPGTQPCGWGAGEDPTECFHKGPLYVYNNTVIFNVSTGRKAFLRLQTNEQSAVAFNNIIHVVGSGNPISYMNTKGILNLGVNIVNRGGVSLTNFYQQAGGSQVNGTSNVTVFTSASQTGFVNPTASDYALLSTSPARNTAQPLVSGAQALGHEFHTVQAIRVRPNDGMLDMGAFEYAPTATDTLALFNATANATSRINTLQDLPPVGSYNSYTLAPPAGGQWVMGDWDGNGSKTPGVYAANGVFYTTNATDANATWTATWFGFTNRPPIAGRFNAANNNDCIGVIDNGNFPPYGLAFALYFTCNLSGGNPTKTLQWLSVLLPNSQGHSGTHQFAAGDFDGNGVASIAVRRGPTVAWTNVPPTTQLSEFNLAQYFGTPYAHDAGYFIAGDWDDDGRDSFGLVYQDGAFYRRNDLLWNTSVFVLQRVGLPVGGPITATSWRPNTGGGSGSGSDITTIAETEQPLAENTISARIEAESEQVIRTGEWSTQVTSGASGGAYVYSTDGTLTLEFTGASVEIIYAAGAGSFTVLIDEVAVRTVILDTSSGYASTTINYLSDEGHTLQIVPIAGTVAVDAFVVTGN